MRRGLKFLAILAVLACAGLATQSAFANCQSPDGAYPIIQCGVKAWFDSVPADAGAVNGVWWQLGFGNNLRSRSTLSTGDLAADGGAWATTAGACTVGACTNGVCTTGPVIGADCSTNGNLDCGRCTAGLVGTRCTVVGNCTGFIGNDSGLRVNDPNSAFPPIDLASATAVGGPPGSLCFGSTSNWGSAGSDGCGDNGRDNDPDPNLPGSPGTCDIPDTCDTSTGLCVAGGNDCTVSGDADCTQFTCTGGATPGGPCSVDGDCGSSGETACLGPMNDNRLNKYYGPCLVPAPQFTLAYQADAPMGALLTETNKKYFALAFFATSSRGGSFSDVTFGDYKMDAIGKGATNRGNPNPDPTKPGAFDIIPWQRIPGPQTDPNFVASTVLDGVDPLNTARLTASWSGVRLVDDGSIRPSAETSLGGCSGVGARDCGGLVRYQLQRANVISSGTCVGGDGVAGAPHPGTCSFGGGPCSVNSDCAGSCANFVALGAAQTGTSVSSVAVARDSCVRLRTIFGKVPATLILTNPLDANQGKMGDLGYTVESGILLIGKALVSSNAVLKVAEKNKNSVLIEFDTTGELDVTGFNVVGKDAKGERVISKVSCTECSTGRGAHYSTVIPAGDVRGAKSVLIVTQPSGARSNELPIE